MDIDEILVNLKVLEQLQVNQKLISRGSYLNIEYESIIPEWLRRWRRQDNRNETIKKINLIVNSAIKLKETDKNKTIDKHLVKCINGLKSLKETYAICCQTTARIDVIINNILLNIDDVSLKNKIDPIIKDKMT
tara:strand:- start:15338 stop:15739 length:402 start_codon:yes stop_codon:yes gene_type:complete